MSKHLRTRGLALAPQTFDREAGEVTVWASTETPVPRRDARGAFDEVLSHAPGAVDPNALVGKPVLNSHRRDDLEHLLGTVVAAGIEGGRMWARIRLSERALRDGYGDDIASGVIRAVSIGGRAREWKETTVAGRRVRTAVRWEPMEVSFVSVPADAGATVRSYGMPNDQTFAADADPAGDAVQTRAALNAEIRTIVRGCGLGGDLADQLIDRQATPDEARAAVVDALAARTAERGRIDTTRTRIGTDHDDPVTRAALMGEALYARIDPAHQLSEAARPYFGRSMADYAAESLRARGESVSAMSPASIITRSLHTSSDLPIIAGEVMRPVLRKSYEAAPAGVRRVARQTTARDFRAKRSISFDTDMGLRKVGEHGEFTAGTMVEAEESYRIDTFGRLLGMSRQLIINDDLGALSTTVSRIGVEAAAFEADFLVNLVTAAGGAGPVMNDGATLFHASHGNVAASGAAMSETSLSEARLAMRRQRALNGMLINVEPKFLLVPAALETTAEKLLAQITATRTDDVNTFAGRLTVVVDPRLDDVSETRWYLVADPAQVDGLEYAYLEAEAGPQIETRAGFEVDGIQIKVRLDFGAGFVDWRSWHANAGA